MAKAWKVRGIHPQLSYGWNAQVILAVKIQEVYSWAESIRNPDKVKELHNLRISIKRLRYSMEFFGINYGEEFQDFLKVLADLQEQLGDIHDCDVVEMVLTDYLQELPDRGDKGTDAIGLIPFCSATVRCERQSIRRFCSGGMRLRRQISNFNSLKPLQVNRENRRSKWVRQTTHALNRSRI